MKRFALKTLPVVVAIAAGAGALQPLTAFAGDAVGAKVMLQVWDPRNPERNDVRTGFDSATSISDAITGAWDVVRQRLCDGVKSELAKSDRIGSGYTGRDIVCSLPAAEITSQQVGQNDITVTVLVRRMYLELTTTQPYVGKWGDPRFSVAADLTVRFHLAVVGGTTQVRVARVEGSLSNAEVDSHNFVADIAKAADYLIGFFRGQSYRQLAEGIINSQSVAANATQEANRRLAQLDSALSTPVGHVRTGVWLKKNKLFVAFAPVVRLPDGGSISGRIKWDGSTGEAWKDCSGFRMQATVQTGPAPIESPEPLQFGAAPLAPVGSASYGSVLANGKGGECTFHLANTKVGVPHRVASGAAGSAGSAGNVRWTLTIKPDGWSGTAVPPPVFSGANFVANMFPLVGPVQSIPDRVIVRNPGDPDFSRIVTNPGRVVIQAPVVTRPGSSPATGVVGGVGGVGGAGTVLVTPNRPAVGAVTAGAINRSAGGLR